jgi:GntR family transcriptional regulator
MPTKTTRTPAPAPAGAGSTPAAAPGSAGLPRYVEIANELREHIESAALAPHTLLPSERELSETYQVSRMTARQALTLLENEGYVYRRPPRGTFVAEPRVLFRVGSFSAEVARAGRRPGARLLSAEAITPPPSVQAALGLAAGEQVHALQRLRLADAEPLAIETTYLPAALTPGLLQRPLDASLWALLRDNYDIVPSTAQATLQFIVIDDASASLLRLRSAAPGILQTRKTYDQAGRCIEFARDIYRADRAAFEFDAIVQPPAPAAAQETAAPA